MAEIAILLEAKYQLINFIRSIKYAQYCSSIQCTILISLLESQSLNQVKKTFLNKKDAVERKYTLPVFGDSGERRYLRAIFRREVIICILL